MVTLTSELPVALSFTLKGVSRLETSTEAAVAYEARAATVNGEKTFMIADIKTTERQAGREGTGEAEDQ